MWTNKLTFYTALIASLLLISACSRDIDGLEVATNATTPEVYIDGFSAGLEYAAFGGSVVTAFDVDTDIKYLGSSSMRIAVPDAQDPRGTYAGGVYFTSTGRDLSEYDALTFWARSSQPANIDVLGIGNDLGDLTFVASITDIAVNSNWKKYYIPLPDASKLVDERGMFYYAEGPENEKGYTIWFDEVQFETLGTISQGEALLFDGQDVVRQVDTNTTFPIDAKTTFNLPTGINQDVATAPAYFEFQSTDPSVAFVDEDGQIIVLSAGSTVITATLNGTPAIGSLTINSSGAPMLPDSPAPTPVQDAADVISLFSNNYIDEPVDFYNGFWEFSTTQSETIQINGDDVLRYTLLNFVGIQFTTPTIDISQMTHVHLDLYTFDETNLPAEFKVLLVDIGPDGSFDGNDNSSQELTFRSPDLATEQWFSLDIPLSDFPALTGRSNLAQIVLSGDLPNVFMDNLYFYRGTTTGGGPTEPESAAPTPTTDPSDVISIFSDSYTNVAGTNLNPDWGQATVVTEEAIQGNNTLKYTGLNYQGIELGSAQDVSSYDVLHLDYWSSNSSVLNVFLISPGPQETAFSLSVPTTGWGSVDIPLSAFTGVDLTDIFQMKFDGNGTIYLDNIIFTRGGGMTGGNEPTMAAPTPTFDQASVISLFSNAYNDVPVDTWRTDWSSANFEDVQIAGDDVKKYTSLDFVGIETVASQIDASGMTHFSIDVWSPDFDLFGIKLVDFGADGAFDGGDDVEHQIDFTPAQGQWVTYDIPLADFIGLTTKSNLAQFILVGQPTGNTTLFVDNVFFHN